ncbi:MULTISPECIES: hypothetical protein [unclassified Ruegeria]|uniref:hypothetical protein n=1 Tax=unclassified Ruegeria TaxID=2625375 RepID=UPI001487D551|nr:MULTISPECIES: hypothetical protein [unclassified Ruegeria]NOD75556.1 hypothetical protein [Ruegeria sp. HKCCD4332]NOD91045.1 hypothetical protein [Ruegeria sp. HKCCD4318]NOD95503.1 hypothetical protein [Ruegeria sp. HKCCD4884]NOE16423.1 hypothetical protein [Ruegeria sp. HKCCD4318-2]NOG10214.1 hypothetical protein [Ruegeria sp. HKCCD4315]
MTDTVSEPAESEILRIGDEKYQKAEKLIRTTQGANASNGLKLDRHITVARSYFWDAEGRSTLFPRLLGIEFKGKRVGVFQEAKSFTVLLDTDGEEYEVGVSVRLEVNADRFELGAQVSIPNIAAEAQLGHSKAEMEISVLGYYGPLGDILPAPKAVDVTSYAEYLESFRKIQRLVFSEDGAQYHHPIPLGERRIVQAASSLSS